MTIANVRTEHGPATVTVVRTVGPFIIHRQISDTNFWTVTHKRCGLAITSSRSIDDLDVAVSLATAIVALNADWDFGYEDRDQPFKTWTQETRTRMAQLLGAFGVKTKGRLASNDESYR